MAAAIEEGKAQREAMLIAQAEAEGLESGEGADEEMSPEEEARFSGTITLEELGQMMSSRPLEP
jgi:hypothetical protein